MCATLAAVPLRAALFVVVVAAGAAGALGADDDGSSPCQTTAQTTVGVFQLPPGGVVGHFVAPGSPESGSPGFAAPGSSQSGSSVGLTTEAPLTTERQSALTTERQSGPCPCFGWQPSCAYRATRNVVPHLATAPLPSSAAPSIGVTGLDCSALVASDFAFAGAKDGHWRAKATRAQWVTLVVGTEACVRNLTAVSVESRPSLKIPGSFDYEVRLEFGGCDLAGYALAMQVGLMGTPASAAGASSSASVGPASAAGASSSASAGLASAVGASSNASDSTVTAAPRATTTSASADTTTTDSKSLNGHSVRHKDSPNFDRSNFDAPTTETLPTVSSRRLEAGTNLVSWMCAVSPMISSVCTNYTDTVEAESNVLNLDAVLNTGAPITARRAYVAPAKPGCFEGFVWYDIDTSKLTLTELDSKVLKSILGVNMAIEGTPPVSPVCECVSRATTLIERVCVRDVNGHMHGICEENCPEEHLNWKEVDTQTCSGGEGRKCTRFLFGGMIWVCNLTWDYCLFHFSLIPHLSDWSAYTWIVFLCIMFFMIAFVLTFACLQIFGHALNKHYQEVKEVDIMNEGGGRFQVKYDPLNTDMRFQPSASNQGEFAIVPIRALNGGIYRNLSVINK